MGREQKGKERKGIEGKGMEFRGDWGEEWTEGMEKDRDGKGIKGQTGKERERERKAGG